MKVEEIAENAIRILSEKRLQQEQKEEVFDLNELKEVLSKGGSVVLKKKDTDSVLERNALELISSLRRVGLDVIWEKTGEMEGKENPKRPTSPDKEILDDILSEVIEKESPCIIEPGKICINCQGRCQTLGF